MEHPFEELTLTLKVSKEVTDGLRAEALRQKSSLDSVVMEDIEDYLDTPTSQILADIREGVSESARGGGVPALEAIAAICRKLDPKILSTSEVEIHPAV
ncbi:MAG: hypothetical protein MUF38_01780 [Anaerolineae bacterium]|jgi:predicted transcriptional regulator|nr:hypothetical protein [Anaerolineae bacterium]